MTKVKCYLLYWLRSYKIHKWKYYTVKCLSLRFVCNAYSLWIITMYRYVSITVTPTTQIRNVSGKKGVILLQQFFTFKLQVIVSFSNYCLLSPFVCFLTSDFLYVQRHSLHLCSILLIRFSTFFSVSFLTKLLSPFTLCYK